MTVGSIIGGGIFLVIAAACGFYTSLAARCKGPLLSNPWIFMSKEEREKELAKVDIKAEYRQLAVIFGCLTLLFGYLSASFLLPRELPMFPLWIIAAVMVVYAIGSSLKFMKKQMY